MGRSYQIGNFYIIHTYLIHDTHLSALTNTAHHTLYTHVAHIMHINIQTYTGVGGLAIGLSARDIAANFLGGMLLLINEPFTPGDMVSCV